MRTAPTGTPSRCRTPTWRYRWKLPRPSGDGAVSATVPDETLTKAAEHADQALKEIEAEETPKGMSQEDAAAIEALMSQADKEDVTVVVSLKVDVKDEAQVEEAEANAIKDVAAAGEDVSLYLELSVESTGERRRPPAGRTRRRSSSASFRRPSCSK